jgi:hypothetical protein
MQEGQVCSLIFKLFLIVFAGQEKTSKIWQFFKLLPSTCKCKCLVVDNVTELVCSSIIRRNAAWTHLQHHHASLYRDLNLSQSSRWKQKVTMQIGRLSEFAMWSVDANNRLLIH